jgi:uncharacterized protein (DUF433 family)
MAIQLVDRGRGLQLSTSRVTVQDLVPYFEAGCSHAEIIRWIPTLSAEEIEVVERYFREHREQLLEQDRQIRAHREEQIRLQQIHLPAEDRQKQFERMKQLLRTRLQEKNGEGHPG